MTVPHSMQTPLNSPGGRGTVDSHQEHESSRGSSLRDLNLWEILFTGICLPFCSRYMDTDSATSLFSPPAFVIL